MKRLIVTGDDFGLSPGVVRGILKAHEKGILTSASLMVNAPATDEAFQSARQVPSLAVGLHFVLTFGRPIGPEEPLAPILGPEGTFVRLDSSAHEALAPQAVRGELEAQLNRFVLGLGREPSHIDGHHHAHALPQVLRCVLELARERGLPVRAPTGAVQTSCRAAGVETTGHFIGSFYGREHVSTEALLRILHTLGEGTHELMCHPSTEDPALNRLSAYQRERHLELETLTAPAVRAAVRELGIELIPTSRL